MEMMVSKLSSQLVVVILLTDGQHMGENLLHLGA